MTREEAQRIVKGFLAGVLVDGAFSDALHNAGITGEDAHELRNAAMAVAYELRDAAGVRPGNLGQIMRAVTGRLAA